MSQYIISVPTARTVHTIALENTPTIKLDFNPAETQVERTDNDLSLQFPNEGTVILSDFFVTNGAELPTLVLQDGTEITSADLLASLDPTMDISTAAGLTTASSSGLNAYGDGSGDLLDGLDRLGSLESMFWSGEVTERNLQDLAELFQDPTPPLTAAPTDPGRVTATLGTIAYGAVPNPGESSGPHTPQLPEQNRPGPGNINNLKNVIYGDNVDLSIVGEHDPNQGSVILLGTNKTPGIDGTLLLNIKAGSISVETGQSKPSDIQSSIHSVYSDNAVHLTSTDGDISLTSSGQQATRSYGIFNASGSNVKLTSANDIDITALNYTHDSNSRAVAINSTGAGANTTLKAHGNITLKAEADSAAEGLSVRSGTNEQTYNKLEGQTVRVDVLSNLKDATGLDNTFGGGLNHIESSNTIINVAGYTGAKGLDANYHSLLGSNPDAIPLVTRNHIEAKESITLDITSSNGDATGLLAGDTQGVGVLTENILEAGNSITVTVTGQAGGLSAAMAAFGTASHNNIIVGKNNGTESASVDITGNMTAGEGGKNTIQTFDGNDSVSITGDISLKKFNSTDISDTGKNIIDTGKGDYIITLNGAVAKGALTIAAGDGTDTLVLKADSISEFNTNYKAWLENLGTNAMDGMSIEKISIDLENNGGLAGLQWLNEYIKGLGSSNITLTIGGDAVDWDTVLSAPKIAGLFHDGTEADTALDAFVESFSQESTSQQFHTGDNYIPDVSNEDVSLYILQSVTGL